MSKDRLDKKEALYFYLTGNWYTGQMPNFYNAQKIDATRILEESYEVIKKEVLAFYEEHAHDFQANFTPYKYSEAGWRTINLIGFMLKYQQNIAKFPKLYNIASKIPHLLTLQVAVLNPKTRVKAHFGDTNAIIRSHLGLVIPGDLPDIGFRNGSTEVCWKEGKVLSFCVAHRHYVWNNTESKRIIILLDTIHPAYVKEKVWICSGLLAASLMKLISTKCALTKRFPHFIIHVFHKILTVVFRFLLFLQESFNIPVATVWKKN